MLKSFSHNELKEYILNHIHIQMVQMIHINNYSYGLKCFFFNEMMQIK